MVTCQAAASNSVPGSSLISSSSSWISSPRPSRSASLVPSWVMSTSISWPRTWTRKRRRVKSPGRRGEAHLAVRVAQAGEAGDQRQPGPASGGDVDAVRGVAVRVQEVDSRGLEEVVERRIRVADLRRHHALDRRREPRVVGREGVVVVERPPLLLVNMGDVVPLDVEGLAQPEGVEGGIPVNQNPDSAQRARPCGRPRSARRRPASGTGCACGPPPS
jgi:hypothetical protein